MDMKVYMMDEADVAAMPCSPDDINVPGIIGMFEDPMKFTIIMHFVVLSKYRGWCAIDWPRSLADALQYGPLVFDKVERTINELAREGLLKVYSSRKSEHSVRDLFFEEIAGLTPKVVKMILAHQNHEETKTIEVHANSVEIEG